MFDYDYPSHQYAFDLRQQSTLVLNTQRQATQMYFFNESYTCGQRANANMLLARQLLQFMCMHVRESYSNQI